MVTDRERGQPRPLAQHTQTIRVFWLNLHVFLLSFRAVFAQFPCWFAQFPCCSAQFPCCFAQLPCILGRIPGVVAAKSSLTAGDSQKPCVISAWSSWLPSSSCVPCRGSEMEVDTDL